VAPLFELEQRLQVANDRLERARAALAPKHQGGEWEEFRKAHQDVLLLERQFAAAKGEEFAEPFGFPLIWDCGTPRPQLMANDGQAFLAFRLKEPRIQSDSGDTSVKGPKNEVPQAWGLVEFCGCISTRFGSPNDEVFEGHSLWGKGLEFYEAQRVVNSRWIREIETINKIHSMYNPVTWLELNHLVFWFHDSSFECIARAWKTETFRISRKEMLGIMVDRLMA